MKDGYQVIDMDTHVNPSMEVLEKYVNPGFRPRLAALKPYYRVHKRPRPDGTVQTSVGITVAPIPYDRFPGEAPREEYTTAMPGGRTALEGRVITHHRRAVQPGVDEENAEGRIADMDLEGRDIDFIFPGTWAASLTALDVTLAEGLYRAYHRYMHDYTARYPDRLKSAAQLPGADVEWAVQEIKTLAQEKWLAAVWLDLPEGKPIDHPDFEPLWATMNDLDLPLIHHSFFVEPPYFPGYRDIWGNAAVARTAAHP
jgi:predicted TIM-barrel fold metal-dependent hydrolase